MKIGISEVDITPRPGVELSGFAARQQPSVGVLDPLFAKALYLEQGETRALWIHCDLIGFDRAIVTTFRQWAWRELGLRPEKVMLSATHTHAGPSTLHLREAGEYDPAYVQYLHGRLAGVAERAMAQTEEVQIVTAKGLLHLAVDRRGTGSAHTDPRIGAVGFRRADGTFVAAIVNYPIHPVALGATNRCISSDISGQAAAAIAEQLPGKPVVLMTNGACANLNPPTQNVPVPTVAAWGKQIADAITASLASAAPLDSDEFVVVSRTVALPLDTLDADGINAFADKALLNAAPLAEWGDKYRRVVQHWRTSLLEKTRLGAVTHADAELFAVGIGGVILLGVNAEVFSDFTDSLRRHTSRPLYLIGYANGDLGYLPTRAAYAEGGYEVEVAHMFYGGFRPKAGGLELLADSAVKLLEDMQSPSGAEPGTVTRRRDLSTAEEKK